MLSAALEASPGGSLSASEKDTSATPLHGNWERLPEPGQKRTRSNVASRSKADRPFEQDPWDDANLRSAKVPSGQQPLKPRDAWAHWTPCDQLSQLRGALKDFPMDGFQEIHKSSCF